MKGCRHAVVCLKKNQKAPRPSEHPPVREEKMSKRLGGIKGCKYMCCSTCVQVVYSLSDAHKRALN